MQRFASVLCHVNLTWGTGHIFIWYRCMVITYLQHVENRSGAGKVAEKSTPALENKHSDSLFPESFSPPACYPEKVLDFLRSVVRPLLGIACSLS